MKVDMTRYDIFLDYYLSLGRRTPTISEMIEDLERTPGMWDDQWRASHEREAKRQELLGFIAKAPKLDDAGNIIERRPVRRKDEEGNEIQPYLPIPEMTYEDKVKDIRRCLRMSRRYMEEAKRLYEDYLGTSTKPERRKLERQFAGVFDFMDAPPMQEAFAGMEE